MTPRSRGIALDLKSLGRSSPTLGVDNHRQGDREEHLDLLAAHVLASFLGQPGGSIDAPDETPVQEEAAVDALAKRLRTRGVPVVDDRVAVLAADAELSALCRGVLAEVSTAAPCAVRLEAWDGRSGAAFSEDAGSHPGFRTALAVRDPSAVFPLFDVTVVGRGAFRHRVTVVSTSGKDQVAEQVLEAVVKRLRQEAESQCVAAFERLAPCCRSPWMVRLGGLVARERDGVARALRWAEPHGGGVAAWLAA